MSAIGKSGNSDYIQSELRELIHLKGTENLKKGLEAFKKSEKLDKLPPEEREVAGKLKEIAKTAIQLRISEISGGSFLEKNRLKKNIKKEVIALIDSEAVKILKPSSADARATQFQLSTAKNEYENLKQTVLFMRQSTETKNSMSELLEEIKSFKASYAKNARLDQDFAGTHDAELRIVLKIERDTREAIQKLNELTNIEPVPITSKNMEFLSFALFDSGTPDHEIKLALDINDEQLKGLKIKYGKYIHNQG